MKKNLAILFAALSLCCSFTACDGDDDDNNNNNIKEINIKNMAISEKRTKKMIFLEIVTIQYSKYSHQLVNNGMKCISVGLS